MKRFVLLGSFGALLALTANGCGPTTPANDTSNTDAVVNPDTVVTPDVVGTDAIVSDTPPGTDGGDAAPGDGGPRVCNMVPLKNLDTLGMRSGMTVTYTGDNTMAPNTSTTLGIQIAGGRGSATCNFRTVRERVFEYTAMTTSVLRVSTTNMGTAANLDTTITVVRPTATGLCSLTGANAPALIGCNDDDPRYSGDDRRLTSVVVTPTVIMAGSRVWIAVGAFAGADGTRYMPNEQGAFVLTVDELAPVATAGMCDPRRLDNACADTDSCVDPNFSTGTGACRTNGSVAGARCMGTTCGAGLSCTNGLCLAATATAGQPCGGGGIVGCATGFSCVTLEVGSLQGTCRADGSVLGAGCDSTGSCSGTGLTCVTGTTGAGLCLTQVAMNAACSTYDTSCPATQNCERASLAAGTAGTCANLGTVSGGMCDTTGQCSTSGLTCTTVGTAMACEATVPTGGSCSAFSACANGGTCYFVNDSADRFSGQCFDPMTLGGPCDSAGMCNSGLTCSDMTNPANGRCLGTPVTMGGTCDLLHACATDLTCVPSATLGSMPFAGTCQPVGARGAPCGAMNACTTGTCSGTGFVGAGICQTAATTTCDARYSTDRCATGMVCRATSLTAGTCAAPTQETEPNNVPATTLTAVTTPAAIHGALPLADVAGAGGAILSLGADTDCYALTVPANGHIFARVSTSAGLCPAFSNMQLDLYRIDSLGLRRLGNDANSGPYFCPRIDGNDAHFPWASNLTAGTYYVCLHNEAPVNSAAGTPISSVNDYVISLNVN